MGAVGQLPQAGLELRDLAKMYGMQVAIKDISVTVGPGEFVSLLGPSGSGKTTTLSLIAGFIMPDHGQVLLNGTDITALPPHRRNLGMVYQNYALFPHMTVEDNVGFPLEMRGVRRNEIRRRVGLALNMVQLDDKSDRYPRQLSGGQQQRVALARALVFEPPLLLMDEPLGALDKKLRSEMQQEIKSIQRRLGITTIYVTHDQEEALSMSDRVVVMRAGRIEQVASPTALYDRPANSFVADFIGAANLLQAVVVATDALATVRTAGGLLILAAVAGLNVGDLVTVVLRPERIRLSKPAQDTASVHTGKLENASFAGGLWRYRVALGTGEHILVTETNSGAEPVKIGDVVAVDWRPDDVWITPAGKETKE
jgi:spermidine/putrescine ABC transporter ATP-binding subunit